MAEAPGPPLGAVGRSDVLQALQGWGEVSVTDTARRPLGSSVWFFVRFALGKLPLGPAYAQEQRARSPVPTGGHGAACVPGAMPAWPHTPGRLLFSETLQ